MNPYEYEFTAFDGKRVRELAPDEVAYTMPNALFLDHSGGIWIADFFPTHPHAAGTMMVKITRTADGVLVEDSAISLDTGYAYSFEAGHFKALPATFKERA